MKMEEERNSEHEESREEQKEYVVEPGTGRTYLKGRFLGQGAHAMVYLVTDLTENTNREYAMKVMRLEGDSVPETKETFPKVRSRHVKLSQVKKEVDIHGLMKHKNVVRLERHFRSDFKFYMIIEFCEMNTLAQLLRNRKRMTENESRSFLRQLLAGLQHIHERGIIHRDLKPANIYITQDLVLKIGDFGLADRVRCKSKGICGTPNYISPEVLNEQGYTTAVDIWAVGCIAYHMITGKPPFEAINQCATYELIRAHKYSAIPPSQAGAALRHLISWMLAFRPEDRPSIPLIFGHSWMKRNCKRQGKLPLKMRSTLFRFNKDAESYTAPNEESLTHSGSGNISRNKDGAARRETSVWRSIVEKAKILSAEQVLESPVLHRLTRKGFHLHLRDPIKKAMQQLLAGVPKKEDEVDGTEISNFDSIPVFVSKWIDYSNKYGFGYELTDGSSGVFFNDSSQISLDANRMWVTWCEKNRRSTHPIRSVPRRLQQKLSLLDYFIDYMDANLSGGFLDHHKSDCKPNSTFINKWRRNEKMILFEMTNGLLQINFSQDHYKFLIYQESTEEADEMILISIDDDKKMRKYNLRKIGKNGCPENIITHLLYIHSFL